MGDKITIGVKKWDERAWARLIWFSTETTGGDM
jgi:hypothetical protein